MAVNPFFPKFSPKMTHPAFLPRIGQKREFRQNGWTDGGETWQAGCRRPLSDCVSLGSQCPRPSHTSPTTPFRGPSLHLLRFLLTFCHSSNHLSRTFWIISKRLKYFPNSDRRLSFFSKRILASVSRYQACPKWLCAHGTTQHYSGASGHKWTVWMISTFVDIVHCWNMKLSSLIHNTVV